MSEIQTKLHHDTLTDVTTIERTQDVSGIIQDVADKRQHFDGFKSESMNFVGTIPGIIVEQYLKAKGISYQEFIGDKIHIRRILNDPDYSKFKVFEGRI